MPSILNAATTSAGKLRDFSAAAGHSGIRIEPLPGLRDIPAPEEDQPTFEGNARLKAAYYSRFAPDLLVLADDSGLEVDALSGHPGVRSARYAADAGFSPAGVATLDERNNLYLLEQMKNIAAEVRTARYRCVLAVARGGEVLAIGEGAVEGSILTAPRGDGGFGYDPLFWLPELHKTMAEIDPAAKNGFSHRGRAFSALIAAMAEQNEKM
ncbi:non-canonical purine NTP pyrophosphatase [Paracidobacterium acidisoli]|uniref:dITP/XTP pyrophosphatase n=1 Tax=Paracidobacterium acidisoli TaxID=2303751 RepID=A0A372IUN8_9BACT|nr:non-canonical purine NTP pyrophosphatase [Paracidobacterium acidisoli]MBT9329966.1 non-canonical purine NTP pyrophosphatase [Paracidobacterium acidisoli]